MSRPHSASSSEPSNPAAESPTVHVKIFKIDPGRYLALSAQLKVIAFGDTPEKAAEAFVSDASYHVQCERDMGTSSLIYVSKEEDPEKKLKPTLTELLTDLQIDYVQLHSSVEVRLKLEPRGHPECILITDFLAATDVP